MEKCFLSFGIDRGVSAQMKSISKQSVAIVIKQDSKSLSDYLFNGAIEVWSATETLTDASGQIISVKQISKTVRRGPPQWAIDRVLGQPINELESIKALVELGWLEEQLVERLGAAMDKFTESAKAVFQGGLDNEDLDAQSDG